VTILTANRGYDNPDERFEPFEDRAGVAVRRLPASSFGKASMPVRIFGQLSFLLKCIVRGLFSRGLTDLLVSTSPPMCGIVAVLIGWLRPFDELGPSYRPAECRQPGRIHEHGAWQKVIELTVGKSTIVYRPMPEDDPKQRQLDVTQAKAILGWGAEDSV
jgi:hypothetical protein